MTYHSKGGAAKKIAKDLNFYLDEGELLAVFGQNGCGKTTFLKFLCGLHMGDLECICGSYKKLKTTDIAYVPQHSNLAIFKWLSVLDNIAIVGRLAGLPIKQARTRALSMVESLGIDLDLDKLGENLSGGESFINILARELSKGPKLLLVDEGFSSLELGYRLSLLDRLKQHLKTNNISMIHVSHHPIDAIQLSDRILLMTGSPATFVNLYPYKNKIELDAIGHHMLRFQEKIITSMKIMSK